MDEILNNPFFWAFIAGLCAFVGAMYKIMAAKRNLPVDALDEVVDAGVKLATEKAEECAEKQKEEKKDA